MFVITENNDIFSKQTIVAKAVPTLADNETANAEANFLFKNLKKKTANVLEKIIIDATAEKLNINDNFEEKLNVKKTVLYCVLFLLSILIVFRIVPVIVGLVLITATLLITDREALFMVDYALLGTFFFFFIFAGNLSRVEAVNTLLSGLLEKDTLLVSVLSCQVISNVPSAILLSRFTTNYPALLMGVNIGGTGTLIASLASLITFSEHRILYPGHSKFYFALFTVVNFIFLAVMTVAAKLWFV